MTLRELTAVKGMREASLALLCGLALCAWVYRKATAVEPLPEPRAAMNIVPGALDGRGPAPAVNVGAAVAVDIFAPERKAPPKRYRMPGQADPPPPPATPVVLGTTVGGDPSSSFCTCQLASSRLVFARVGDVLGIYTVKSIERGKVVFTTATGSQLEILALKPGS